MENHKNLIFLSEDKMLVSLEIRIRRNNEVNKKDWDTLEPVESLDELSICGRCGNGCGQILDDFKPTPTQQKLVDFWKKYHLNGMITGTKRQEALLDKARKENENLEYEDRCLILRTHNLLIDHGYQYGTGWLCKTFPEKELESIVADVEKEYNDYLEQHNAIENKYDINADYDEEMYKAIDELFNDPGRRITMQIVAFMRYKELEWRDIEDIHLVGYNDFLIEYLGTNYFSAPEDDAREYIKNNYLDKDQWIEAAKAGQTTDSLEDWQDWVIGVDGYALLNSYDGTYDTVYVGNESFVVCES